MKIIDLEKEKIDLEIRKETLAMLSKLTKHNNKLLDKAEKKYKLLIESKSEFKFLMKRVDINFREYDKLYSKTFKISLYSRLKNKFKSHYFTLWWRNLEK